MHSKYWIITSFPNHFIIIFSSDCSKGNNGGLIYVLCIAPQGKESKFLRVLLPRGLQNIERRMLLRDRGLTGVQITNFQG